MTSQSESSSASSASKRERLRAASRRLASRSRSGFSPADTPPAIGGVPSLRGTAVDVSGGTPVKAIVYPAIGTYCGSIIGQGMFFCLKQNCVNVGHNLHRADEKIGAPGKIYILSSGKAPRAFCEPCVDSALLDPNVVLLLTKRAYPDARLKWVLKELRANPRSLSAVDLENFLSGEAKSFRTQMKAMLTPAKVAKDGFETKSQLAKDLESLSGALEKGFDSGLESPKLTVPHKEPLTGSHLENFSKALEIQHNHLCESTAIGLMIVDEVEDVKNSLGESLVAFESSIGSDPGIGGEEVGILSSAWEGVEFVNNSVRDLTAEVRFAQRGNTASFKNILKRLDDYSASLSDWDEKLSANVLEQSGRYARGFSDYISKTVERVIADFGDDDEDADDGGNPFDGPFDVPQPNGIAWEGGRGGLHSNAGGPARGGGYGGHGGGGGGGNGPPGYNGVGFDIDVNAEMTKLMKEFEKMKMDMNHLKSVTSTGMLRFPMVELEFESEEKLRDYMLELHQHTALPNDVSALFADLWALMDEAGRGIDGDQRQASDVQIARQRESATKASFSSTTTLSRAAGFERLLPLLFEAPNTPASTDPIMKPLPGLKKYEDFDCHAGGGQGRKQLIEEEFERTINTLGQNITSQLHEVEFYKFLRFAEAFMTMALDQKRTLYDWIRNTYDKEKTASSPQEAWALVAGCIRAIFKEIKDARLIGRATSGLTGIDKEARLIWAMGMGAMKLQEFRDVRYHGHSSVQSVYTTYMNRARVPISSFNALDVKVKSMHGEIARLHTEVDKLKKQRAGRGSNSAGASADTPAASS